MSENDEYIEAYFAKELNEAEKNQFEERCVQDEVFARQVAFYISTREAIRQTLLEQKAQIWPEKDDNAKAQARVRNISSDKKKGMSIGWWPFAAAASFLIVIAGYFLFQSQTPSQRADRYIKQHYTELSQTMNASGDSIQQGIAAYNDKDYRSALRIFHRIDDSHPGNPNVKKYIGLVYLVTKEYDQALLQFDELYTKKDVYKNPGLFLKAVTLLERNQNGDKEQAKQLLEQVVNENEEGSNEARQWLEKW
jgi:hypothetical protein